MSAVRRVVTLVSFGWLTSACADGTGPVAEPIDQDVDGFVASDDCDDLDPAIHPGAEESCNGADDDCDGAVDEDAVDASSYFRDADGDTYGDAAVPLRACGTVPPGASARGDDCDDLDAAVHPAADEVCDGVDQDCDRVIDEASVDAVDVWTDSDGDGYGAGASAVGCPGVGWAAVDGDCEDTDGAVSPGASEVCDNGVDDDCDPTTRCRRSGKTSNPDTAADAAWSAGTPSLSGVNPWGAWVGDVDGDGYTDAAVAGALPDPGVAVLWGGDPMVDGALPGASYLSATDLTTGFFVVDGGDIDGDGFGEILLATKDAVRVLSGSATRFGAADLDDVSVSLTGEHVQDVAFLGDVDGDGLADFAVGDVRVRGADAGAVWLILGGTPVAGTLADTAVGSVAGQSGDNLGAWGTTDGGDVDGDGLADLLTCGSDAIDRTGDGTWRAVLTYGDSSGLSGAWAPEDADARFTEDGHYGMYTPCDVGVLPDVDGDGRAEVAFGLGSMPAHVWLWTGQAERLEGDYDETSAFADLSGASSLDVRVTGGDLDGDGFGDVAVGQPWNNRINSEVALFYGQPTFGGELDLQTDADARIEGTSNFGVALALDLSGDGDGDGNADLLGVPAGTSEAPFRAWLFYGAGE